jgi:N-acetylneuraminate synthase
MIKLNKPYLIAEIGINHNGDINIAKKLIDISKNNGFDAVKFQKRDIELVYSKAQLETPRKSPWGETTRQQKEGLEFGVNEYDDIDNYCKTKNIDWFASAWELNSLDFLDKYNLKYHKIASAMITDKEFVEAVAKRKKHTFISTGMSTKEDIDYVVNVFKKNSCSFELMHCVSTYPLKNEMANMSTILELKKIYNCNVGYSGHENGAVLSASSVLLGISSLERHITLDRTMYGSDQAASLEPHGMTALVNSINTIVTGYGTPKVGYIHPEEIPIAEKLRAHINTKK